MPSRDRNRSHKPYERDGETLKKIKSKVDIKNHIATKLNKWSFYDSTTNNNLVEQRKIIDRKNYEMDSRAFAIKDYGY